MLKTIFLIISVIYAVPGFAGDSSSIPFFSTLFPHLVPTPKPTNTNASTDDLTPTSITDMTPESNGGYPQNVFGPHDRVTKTYLDPQQKLVLLEQDYAKSANEIPVYYSPIEFYAATGTILPKPPRMLRGDNKQVRIYFDYQDEKVIDGLVDDAVIAVKVWAKLFKTNGILVAQTKDISKADLIIQVKMKESLRDGENENEVRMAKNKKGEVPVIRLVHDDDAEWTTISSVKNGKMVTFSKDLTGNRVLSRANHLFGKIRSMFGNRVMTGDTADFIIKNRLEIDGGGDFLLDGMTKRLAYSHILRRLGDAFGYPELVAHRKKLYPEFDVKYCQKFLAI